MQIAQNLYLSEKLVALSALGVGITSDGGKCGHSTENGTGNHH